MHLSSRLILFTRTLVNIIRSCTRIVCFLLGENCSPPFRKFGNNACSLRAELRPLSPANTNTWQIVIVAIVPRTSLRNYFQALEIFLSLLFFHPPRILPLQNSPKFPFPFFYNPRQIRFFLFAFNFSERESNFPFEKRREGGERSKRK